MPTPQTLKIKGSICNGPIDNIENNCRDFLKAAAAESNGIIIVKLIINAHAEINLLK